MKDAIPVHVVDSFEHLVHVILDSLFWQVVPPALDCLIHVHIHQFEDQGQSASWLITVAKKMKRTITKLKQMGGEIWLADLLEHFMQCDDIGMG